MPSSVIAQVLEIKNIRPHSDPEVERLELCDVGGWQLVVGKGLYQEGERVLYVTPDSLITEKLADILEIRQHLGSVKNPDGSFVTDEGGNVMLRVRQAKLRGEPSFGTTVPYGVVIDHCREDIRTLPLGTNLAEQMNILKYEPAMRASAGDAEVDHPLFIKYTNIENIRNFPDVLEEGEPVYITQKIHGTNCRVGIIEGEFMAGSHGLRRKQPSADDYAKNTYWYPLSLTSVNDLLNSLYLKGHRQVVLFGEVYGNVQKKYSYGVPNGIAFRAFDLFVDGRYLDYNYFIGLCKEYEVPFVEFFDSIEYSYDRLVQLAEGIEQDPLGQHPLEGVVVRPYLERNDRKIGRVILKYITNKYLFDNKKSDYTDI